MLEPTVVAGSTISMATLHNPDDIIRKDIRPGELVIIEKAGDVIPRVVGPVDKDPDRPTPRWAMPTDVSDRAAASCRSPKTKRSGDARTARARRSCTRGLEHFASRGAMNIEGHGRVADLAAAARRTGRRATPTSIASTPRRSKASSGWARSPRPRCSARSRSRRRTTCGACCMALGIRHVGERGAQVLADHFGSIDAIENATLDAARIGPRDRPGARRRRCGSCFDRARATAS